MAGIGYLRWTDRDAIPQAAEFILNEENVHTAVVFGISFGASFAASFGASFDTSVEAESSVGTAGGTTAGGGSARWLHPARRRRTPARKRPIITPS